MCPCSFKRKEKKGGSNVKQKDKGMLEHFLPALVTIVFMGILWFGSMVTASNIDKSSALNQVTRKYILRMETDGYLTQENRTSMVSELQTLGVEGVDLTGTSLTNVGYGNQVILKVTGTLKVRSIAFRGFTKSMLKEETIPWSVSRVSVAKN